MSVNAYNRIKLFGVEVLGADPIVNLFTGRSYFNSSVDQLRVYNGGTWVSFGSTFSPYTKRVGPGEAYTTLAAVAAAAVAGDWILVTGNTTDGSDVDFTASDIHIDWEPNAVSTFNGGAHTNMLTLSGARIKTNRLRVSFAPSAGATKGLNVTGAACQVLGGHVTFDTAQSITTGVHANSNFGQYMLTIQNGGGATLGTAFSDTGTNAAMVVGP